ncbi:MAG: hypothetical protein C0519_06440 [Hyphomicrobium sp.]|nr:hypothetical protein [Hyphomicrobium sp.]
MKKRTISLAALAAMSFGFPALAQQGPVAMACNEDIAKYCANKEHGKGEVRACLEAAKDKVTDECKAALDTTGPGKGNGQGPRN